MPCERAYSAMGERLRFMASRSMTRAGVSMSATRSPTRAAGRLMTTPRPTGTSADPPRGGGPAWERPGARPAKYRLTLGVSCCHLRHASLFTRGAALHFLAQVVPDRARDVDELLLVADLARHARTRDVDVVDRLDGGRAGCQHIDLVGERDRFLEVVGHENDGRLRLRPQP